MTGYESQYHHHVIKDRIRAENRASLTVATGKAAGSGGPTSPTYKPPPLGLHSPHRHSTVRSLAENRKLMECPRSVSPTKGAAPSIAGSGSPPPRSASPISPKIGPAKPAPTAPHLAHTHHFGWAAPSDKGLNPGNAKPRGDFPRTSPRPDAKYR